MDWYWINCVLMRVPRWFMPPAVQAEVVDRTLAGLGFEPDAAPVAFDDIIAKGEPHSSAGFLPVGRVLEPLEDAENLLMKLGTDTNPVIPDIKHVSLEPLFRVDRPQKSDFDDSLGLVVVFDRISYE